VLVSHIPASGAQHGNLDEDLRTSALLGTLSIQSVNDYYPFAPFGPATAAELVDRMAILVAGRRFHGMGGRSLRYDSYVYMQQFARRTTSIPFRRSLIRDVQ
jgi:hypothetical protein